MPDFAPNYTPRYKLRYFGNGHIHTQLWRPPTTSTIADAATFALFVSGYYAALAPDLCTDAAVVDASWAEADSDVFLPCATPTIIGTGLAGPAPAKYGPEAVSFVGRSVAGLRWVLYQYGTDFSIEAGSTGNNYRLTAVEETVILDVTSFLNGESGTFVANDDNPVLVKPYANIKANDYWVRKHRG